MFILFIYLFLKFYLFIYFYGCVGSLFLCEGFLQLRQVGATLHRGARASHYRGFSVAEHRLQTRRLSNCDSRAQSLRGMWDLPRPGLEIVSPALAGRFSTTVPPGKPLMFILIVASLQFSLQMKQIHKCFSLRLPLYSSMHQKYFMHTFHFVTQNVKKCALKSQGIIKLIIFTALSWAVLSETPSLPPSLLSL